MTTNELIVECAKRMKITVDDIISLKGTELSEDYTQGFCQGCLDYMETLQNIIVEQN